MLDESRDRKLVVINIILNKIPCVLKFEFDERTLI